MKKGLVVVVVLALATTFVGGVRGDDPPPDPPTSLVGETAPSLSIPAGEQNRPTYDGCGGVFGVPSSNESYEQEVVELVNDERAARGLPPLKHVALLDDAARYHATDMAADDYFKHDSYDRSGGDLVWTCDWAERVQSYYSGASYLAENIAAGYQTPASVMNGWMNSQGHRNNILSTSSREIGVGYYRGGSWGRYWVQDFGRRNNVYPVIIEGEAAETDSQTVSLYVYGEGWATQMRFRNEGEAWSDWIAYDTTHAWSLPCGLGTKTVEVEINNGSETRSSTDRIELTNEDYLLAVGRGSVSFLYEIASGTLVPDSTSVSLQSEGISGEITWTATKTGDWFTISPISGTTPSTLTITPDNYSTTPGTYTGSVTVTVTDPDNICNSPQTIDVQLVVVNELDVIFLPLVLRNSG